MADQLLENWLGLGEGVLAKSTFVGDQGGDSLGMFSGNYGMVKIVLVSCHRWIFIVELGELNVVSKGIQGNFLAFSDGNERIVSRSLEGSQSLKKWR